MSGVSCAADAPCGRREHRHLDGSDLAQADGGRGARTEFTLLLYLRAPATGGQTRFYDERGGVCGDVAPVEGAALAFRQGYDGAHARARAPGRACAAARSARAADPR